MSGCESGSQPGVAFSLARLIFEGRIFAFYERNRM